MELALERSDLREALTRDLRPIRNAAREARRCRLVPYRQPHRRGARAHVALREPELDERAAHAGALRGLEARPIIAEIADVRAVHGEGELPLLLLHLAQSIELRFTVEAAIR